MKRKKKNKMRQLMLKKKKKKKRPGSRGRQHALGCWTSTYHCSFLSVLFKHFSSTRPETLNRQTLGHIHFCVLRVCNIKGTQ